jgi:hypothetical protein
MQHNGKGNEGHATQHNGKGNEGHATQHNGKGNEGHVTLVLRKGGTSSPLFTCSNHKLLYIPIMISLMEGCC